MGRIACDDPTFCRLVYATINRHVGKTIKEIGDLDLPWQPD
jgi:hypothetical protein